MTSVPSVGYRRWSQGSLLNQSVNLLFWSKRQTSMAKTLGTQKTTLCTMPQGNTHAKVFFGWASRHISNSVMIPKGKKHSKASSRLLGSAAPLSASSAPTAINPAHNPAVAPPLAPMFTTSSPNQRHSPAKKPHANTSNCPLLSWQGCVSLSVPKHKSTPTIHQQ